MTFLLLLSLLSFLSLSLFQNSGATLSGTFIDCGALVGSTIDGIRWLPDTDYVGSGTPKNITANVTVETLSTVRSFPNELNRKFCYEVPVFRGARYMVRTTYYYGGVNGYNFPPVFDQMVDGTFWGVVNTTADYEQGLSSYYEGVFLAQGKTMSVCIGSNNYTDSDPFISALEFVALEDSVYNATDFSQHVLSLVSRTSFGYNGTDIIKYPDDEFNRYWEPFRDNAHMDTIAGNNNVSVSGFWNLPPKKIFDMALASGPEQPMEFIWPPVLLANSNYCIALYFADNPDSLLDGGSRTFDIFINHIPYYRNLTVKPDGAVVFAKEWPLSGATNITLNSVAGSNKGPLINGGEIFHVLDLGRRTLTRDVIALDEFKKSLQNPPLDWNGDPCLPQQYTWTGLTCSYERRVRVVTLNLTNMGLSGTLSLNISRLSALNSILLGNNSFSGMIPDLSPLSKLEKLHLEDNRFSGEIPQSLGNIPGLRELFLQNNNLTGEIPSSLLNKSELNLKTSPGNQLSSPPPS